MSELITDTLAIGEQDGFVVLEFPKPIRWVKLDPETAKQAGMQMAKDAYHLQTGAVADGKAIITEQLRGKLTVRVEHMLRSLEAKPRAYTAAQIVDTILAEVS